jgi:hypothetical protein
MVYPGMASTTGCKSAPRPSARSPSPVPAALSMGLLHAHSFHQFCLSSPLLGLFFSFFFVLSTFFYLFLRLCFHSLSLSYLVCVVDYWITIMVAMWWRFVTWPGLSRSVCLSVCSVTAIGNVIVEASGCDGSVLACFRYPFLLSSICLSVPIVCVLWLLSRFPPPWLVAASADATEEEEEEESLVGSPSVARIASRTGAASSVSRAGSRSGAAGSRSASRTKSLVDPALIAARTLSGAWNFK